VSDSPNALGSSLSLSVPLDRRTHVRYEFNSAEDSQFVNDGQGTPFAVHVQNISAGGLSFLADRRIEPGSMLSLELPSKDRFGARHLVMRVRGIEEVSKDAWRIGCEFSRPLSSLELLALL
jgi:hypothetical protein